MVISLNELLYNTMLELLEVQQIRLSSTVSYLDNFLSNKELIKKYKNKKQSKHISKKNELKRLKSKIILIKIKLVNFLVKRKLNLLLTQITVSNYTQAYNPKKILLLTTYYKINTTHP